MKTLKTEMHDKPLSATHYRNECAEYEFSWVKFTNGSMYVWDETFWDEIEDGDFEYAVKPIPQPATKALTESKEEKEALDSINQIHLRDYQKKNKTEHQEEMSAFKSNPVIQLSINELDKFDSEPDSAFASINDAVDSCEWNGEGLPPVGAIYTTNPHFEIELLCKYSSEYVVVGEMLPKEQYNGVEVVIDTFGQQNREFRKPESPQQREEHERLEAAYDLYFELMMDENTSAEQVKTLEDFLDDKEEVKDWLRVVDKTNYRKGVK